MSFVTAEELAEHQILHSAHVFFCRFSCGKYFYSIDLCEVHEYAFHKVDEYLCNVSI